MPETPPFEPARPVQLTVADLPSDVAERVREAQVEDPELIRRILLYGMTHRTVLETLTTAWGR